MSKEIQEKLEEANIDIAECNACGEEIIFLKTVKGKWMPLDMDLEPHWAKCPEADKFRKR